jgi:hypothetical protein
MARSGPGRPTSRAARPVLVVALIVAVRIRGRAVRRAAGRPRRIPTRADPLSLGLGHVDARQRQADDDQESQRLQRHGEVVPESGVADVHGAATLRQPERLRPAASGRLHRGQRVATDRRRPATGRLGQH